MLHRMPGSARRSTVTQDRGVRLRLVIPLIEKNIICISKLIIDALEPRFDLIEALGRKTDFVMEEPGDVVAVAHPETRHRRHVAGAVAEGFVCGWGLRHEALHLINRV